MSACDSLPYKCREVATTAIHVENKVDGENTCQFILVNIELQGVRESLDH